MRAPSVAALMVVMLATPEAFGDGANNHITIRAESSVGGSLSYARRYRSSLFFGGGFGVGFEENWTSFDFNVWDVGHLEAFSRWRPSPYFHVDAGLTALGFSAHDDCGSCSGSFFGVYATAAVGVHYVFLSSRIRTGVGSSGNGSAFGAIVTPINLRFIVPW